LKIENGFSLFTHFLIASVHVSIAQNVSIQYREFSPSTKGLAGSMFRLDRPACADPENQENCVQWYLVTP
jgi:hypothetical protein